MNIPLYLCNTSCIEVYFSIINIVILYFSWLVLAGFIFSILFIHVLIFNCLINSMFIVNNSQIISIFYLEWLVCLYLIWLMIGLGLSPPSFYLFSASVIYSQFRASYSPFLVYICIYVFHFTPALALLLFLFVLHSVVTRDQVLITVFFELIFYFTINKITMQHYCFCSLSYCWHVIYSCI